MYTNQELRSKKFQWEPLYDLGDVGEPNLQCSGNAGKHVVEDHKVWKAVPEMYSKF